MKRTVEERVKEFRTSRAAQTVTMTHDEMAELMNMFGSGLYFCNAFSIVHTAFYFGYMKGFKARKKGAA